jgi:hypothetical protein
MNLSSLIAPGSAILPFAVVLALCAFLLSLPSGEGGRITNSSLVSVPQPIEAPASPVLSAEEPLGMDFPQAASVEVGASLPVVAAPAVDTTSDAVSAMATWWAQRTRHDHAVAPKAAVSARQYRRHRARATG